jgi:hypothetical protein
MTALDAAGAKVRISEQTTKRTISFLVSLTPLYIYSLSTRQAELEKDEYLVKYGTNWGSAETI